ncbi:MAG: hypothetical protein M3R59_00470 [Verrucomicrobiota bacterium]|nr:hypothetical protein [Verrucomicrobiota bacterium]
MNRLVSCLVFLCHGFCVAIQGAAPTHLDAIVKPDFETSRAFELIWPSKLSLTLYNCGRVIVFPYGEPEYSVSVYSAASPSGKVEYRIAFVHLSGNLWEATDAGSRPSGAAGIKVLRKEATLPETTGVILRELWEKMLKPVHQKMPQLQEAEVIPMDSTHYRWALSLHGTHILEGEANSYLRRLDWKTEEFLKLTAYDLRDYCQASVTERAHLAVKIEKRAKRILASLHPSR